MILVRSVAEVAETSATTWMDLTSPDVAMIGGGKRPGVAVEQLVWSLSAMSVAERAAMDTASQKVTTVPRGADHVSQ